MAEEGDPSGRVEDPVEHCREIARRTASNFSSMLQDVTGRRQTEIDVINGAIAEEGGHRNTRSGESCSDESH
ncbi:hypothetical protein MASR1M66_04350 [Aminivibrio sp.]